MYDSCMETAPAVDERAALRAAIRRAHQAWTAGDGRAYAACFTPETRDAPFFGLCRDGRAANAELHAALFHAAARGEAIVAELDAIEWLSADVALVRMASDGARPGYQTYLMVRRDDAWRIRSFQHTPVNGAVAGLARWVRRRMEGFSA